MHHGILGAGCVGGLIGAVLAKAGEDVTLIVRPETMDRQPNELHLESKFGRFSIPVSVVSSVVAPLDVLWITVKATQLDSALENIPPDASVRAIVPLLNGIDHVRVLRERYGNDRVIPATIAVESERIAPGKIVHRSPFIRVNVATRGREILGKVVDDFRQFGFECEYIDNEQTLLWSKLVFLAPLALSTTAAGKPVGDVLHDTIRRAKLQACIRETCAVGRASGAAVDCEPLLATVSGLPTDMQSSMQKDVDAGRMPELDAIAGPILRGAKTYGVQVFAHVNSWKRSNGGFPKSKFGLSSTQKAGPLRAGSA